MASGLAIEQSDLDLAVVGLDFNGCKELQITEMRKLLSANRAIRAFKIIFDFY